MRRWLPLAVILSAAVLAVAAVQLQKVDNRPSPEAVLTLTADAQHELTRIPAAIDRISDQDEVRIGNELARSYSAQWHSTPGGDTSNREIEQYIQTIGLSVSAGARRRLPYTFHYIPDPRFVNAFASPGGHVFVGQGLISLMRSEDALAAVLGHEVEHVDLRHCAERAQMEGRLRDLGRVGSLAALPVDVFVAGYNKEQELEADRSGTALAVRAGYSPLGIIDLFDEFAKLQTGTAEARASSPTDEAAQLSLGTLEGYFASHPPAAQRKQQVFALLQAQRWPTPRLRPLLHADHDSIDASRSGSANKLR